jgi:DNA-directed RNA polymerase specialized sigma24 family protein
MSHSKSIENRDLTAALEAIANLLARGFQEVDHSAGIQGLMAHSEIKERDVSQKSAVFFRHFVPLHKQMIELFADTYRKYLRVALAHPNYVGADPEEWAWIQLQPGVLAALEWMREWYILACEGENQSIRHEGKLDFVPGQTASLSIPITVPPPPAPASWRAPAWLFAVSPLVGIGPLKQQHVPNRNSVDKLSQAHTRLLLKGARRTFLWTLGAAIETVRNEEVAAAGSIPRDFVGKEADQRSKPKHWLKGTEGLVSKKDDLSQYMHKFTEKQELAFSLTYEYGLGLAEVASRMGVHRKTAYEHIAAANRKVRQGRSSEKRRADRAKNIHE